MMILRRIYRGLPLAVEFEPFFGGTKLVKKTKGNLEAVKNLRGKDGDEMKMAGDAQSTDKPPKGIHTRPK